MAWDDVLVAHVSKYTAAIHNEIVNQIKARVLHSLSTAENDVLVGSGSNTWIKKTIAEFKIILGLGSAAYTASTAYSAASHGHAQSDITNLTASLSAITPVFGQLALPSYLYNADDDTKALFASLGFWTQSSAWDGDYFIIPVFCSGDETKLDIMYRKLPFCGIFDIYVNSVLDSSGYDGYDSGDTSSLATATLANPVNYGWNTVKIKINGKNASSTHYNCYIAGVRLR